MGKQTISKLITIDSIIKQKIRPSKFLADTIALKVLNKFDWNKVLEAIKSKEKGRAMDKLNFLSSAMSVEGDITFNQF